MILPNRRQGTGGAGQEEHGKNTVRIDGKEHLSEPGNEYQNRGTGAREFWRAPAPRQWESHCRRAMCSVGCAQRTLTRAETPKVRGWLTRKPTRARVPRSWSRASRAFSSNKLFTNTAVSQRPLTKPRRRVTIW